MRSKKDILIVVASLTGGGAERVAVEWANNLAALGHRVTVMTDMLMPVTYRLADDVKVVSFNVPPRPRGKGIRFLLWVVTTRICVSIRMLRLMRRLGTDVVIDVGHKYGFEVLMASKVLGVKSIQTDHNACSRPCGVKMGLRDYYRKFLQSRMFDALTVLTETDCRVMKQHGATNVESLYNPLSFSQIKLCENARTKTVLAVGRLDVWRTKGFDILLLAWGNIAKKHPDWNLRIIGDGAPEAVGFLRKLCAECCENVKFAPFTDEIGEEYRRAEVFVLSSRCEGGGLVALEAMAHGCAAVVCDFEGRQGEYVKDGVNGLLCAPGCVGELENAIERVISDEDLRKRLQRNAPKSVERFAPAVTVAKLEEIIYRVCGEATLL
ncbi:MAG: glycosyltransferase [Muribaculaceae bacterium]|nr:glycosyltransferase [Muribaculaceae bacterium]